MTALHDPARAPRRMDDGYKGDAWTVDVPPDGDHPIVLLDTGVDSVCIVRIPDAAWERAARPSSVHAHDGYDETVLVTRASGTLLHGPSPDRLEAVRIVAPVVIQIAAGWWHGVAMDPGVRSIATCFYTVPGTVIEEFSVQMQIIARARVRFADLAEPHPVPVQAEAFTGAPAADAGTDTGGPSPAGRPSAIPGVRVSPYPAPNAEGLTLPLDSGVDGLFIMAAAPGPEVVPSGGTPKLLELPEEVDVHRHPDVDEFILRRHGAGWILNGRTPETVTRTPFRGPCVMVMPAGAFHRIVQKEEDEVGDSILIYSHRRAIVERHDRIMARTTAVPVSSAGGAA